MRRSAVLVLGLAAVLGGCGREPYSQSSPDAVIATAKAMVANGDAEQLYKLIHADNPEMREVLRRIGGVLGNLQDLSVEVHRAFPEEIEALRKQAAEAAARGETTSLLSRMTGMGRGPGGRRARPSQQEQEQFFDRLSKEIFADPYGFLAENESRLTAVYMTDDIAALQWDNKPLFGLTMKEEQGRWSIVLPTNLPGVSEVMPRNREEYSIWGSLVKALDNTITDVRTDVTSGKAQSLEELGRLTGEKVVVPAGLCMLAYAKAVEERRKEKEAKTPDAKDPAPSGG